MVASVSHKMTVLLSVWWGRGVGVVVVVVQCWFKVSYAVWGLRGCTN